MGDWLPKGRRAQITVAQQWGNVLPGKATPWNIPPAEVTELVAATADAEQVLKKAESSDRTMAITAECNRIFAVLVAKMRFVKDRYFKKPPLKDEDFVFLMLEPPKTHRSKRGAPKAQMSAEISRSGTAMLILHYQYAEGTELLADPHTDIRLQIRYGLLPPPGIAPEGNDMPAQPTVPEQLPLVFSSARQRDFIYFTSQDSGKTAYFCIRIENGSGHYGPWCSLFSAIVP